MNRLKKFCFCLIVFTLMPMLFSSCSAKMPVPTITEGRFDFSVTYELNGEEKTYCGVYVCKFDGVYVSWSGNGRDWSGYIENGNGEDEIAIQTNEDGIIYIGFDFRPEYFMADPSYADSLPPEPTLYIIYHSDGSDNLNIDNEDSVDFMAKYGVRIISYDVADPIENTYKEKWSFGRFDFSIN